MTRKQYRQDVLIGRRKRPAVLQTTITESGATFAIIQKGKVIATRSTSQTQDEMTALIRLSKAVAGFSYVFIVPVPQEKESMKARYYKVNN